MTPIKIHTTVHKMNADIHTPVGIYLRLRDKYRDTILLESTDFHSAENSFSFIAIQAIAGVEITNPHQIEWKLPLSKIEQKSITEKLAVPTLLGAFLAKFEPAPNADKMAHYAQGLFGYTAYDAVQFFDTVAWATKTNDDAIPLVRYRLYQYVIVINHFTDDLFLLENHIDKLPSERAIIEQIIVSKDVPTYPFQTKGSEATNLTDEAFLEMVEKGKKHCYRGDVFQIVLSRQFSQQFVGDEFNVYRALRRINPSPYLFYFDYGDYKLMGSSPESQLVIQDGKAKVHPIAGTYKRTGNDLEDKITTENLLQDAKENAEHVMLVDLARNDLSRMCKAVQVAQYKTVHYYSHVIHLVSEVIGIVPKSTNPFALLAACFPAGTLSGAPKLKAMELINAFEPTARGYYGGCIGFVGFDGSFNQAIMIRTLLSKKNTLYYQAGAGVVAASVAAKELQEVNNKLGALKKAIDTASNPSS